MTATLTQAARRMLELESSLGRWLPIASGNATTIVASALADGGKPSSAYEQFTAVRRDAASQPADRERVVTGYTASSGTLTVATMADTTFTSENVELYAPGVNVMKVDQSLNWAIAALKRESTVMIPALKNRTRYPLGTLVAHERWPNDVIRVAWNGSPVLSQNRYLQGWNTYSSTGVLTPPDGFTLSGSGATVTRSTTQTYQSPYSAALLRSGTNATLTQNVGILPTGVASDSLQGETVTVAMQVYEGTASAVRARVVDGSTTTNSDYHTGGSTFEQLTKEVTIGASSTTLTFSASIEVDSTAYIDQLFLCRGAITDAVWRDEYPETVLDIDDFSFDQAANVLTLPSMGQGQWRITTRRPYPAFPAASIAARTADAYSTDADLDAVATVAIWKLFFDMNDVAGMAKWAKAASNYLGRSLYQQPNRAGAVPPFSFLAPARRYSR